MIDKLAFVGDIHGSYEALESALSKVNLNSTKLYFLGDYVDRGEDSAKVLSKCMELSEHDNVECLIGNHDAMLLAFIDDKDLLNIHNDLKLTCFKSFFPDIPMYFNGTCVVSGNRDITDELRDKLRVDKRIDWLRSLNYYAETENQILVHASVDKSLENWKDTPKIEMIWNRPNFAFENKTGKDIIVGHTITNYITDTPITTQPNILQSENEFFIDCANFLFGNARVLVYNIKDKTYSSL